VQVVDRKQISVEDLRKLPTEELVRLLTYVDEEIGATVQ
jgi:hypothetical protein